jgi:hypothetical protein
VRECPYVGLVPFDEEDTACFFGREGESDLIVANLTASRLTLLYPPVGSARTQSCERVCCLSFTTSRTTAA